MQPLPCSGGYSSSPPRWDDVKDLVTIVQIDESEKYIYLKVDGYIVPLLKVTEIEIKEGFQKMHSFHVMKDFERIPKVSFCSC